MTTFERIKDLSAKRGKNVKQVAEELNFGENYFYSLNSGKSPTAEKLEKIADYFNVSVDYLLERTNNPLPDANEDELALMLRKTESQVPEHKRDQYRAEIERYMEFIKFEMNKDEE